ncbi:MAG: PEP/pyruvate-binding domain-containing protein [Deltaproteobacteria bacterium]|nr:PEP/pyruvate-binding domain-containing protein [Deltaproteobacteria bacterium]
MTDQATPKALRLYLELREYPVLCDEIRKRMREEMVRRGVIRAEQFEDEVRAKAITSQERERLDNPLQNELAEVWDLRTSRVRDILTDFYFAHNLPHSIFESIVADVLGERNKQELILSFNPELAPWDMLFAQGEEFENAPPEQRQRTQHHLQEIIVVLTKGMLSDQLAFVGLARKHFLLKDLKAISRRRIGRGKVGGKAAGMWLAWRALQEHSPDDPIEVGPRVKMPDSWFMAADLYYEFIEANDLFGTLNQKYKDLEQSRADYPAFRQLYESRSLTRNVTRRLELVLDQVGDSPLIVRSSSLLEDNFGQSFAGKYETHFCANQGDRQARLQQLCQSVLKVYSSVFNPDALAYRRQMGLIDYDERMAILLQKVEGSNYHGKFFPQIAGVGFSYNPYRWTPQIDRRGGFLRMVWGLGTRAVDRVGRDHPRMVALSHPTLRPERTAHEVRRYSQHFIDAIDLDKNDLVTLGVADVLRHDFPGLRQIASVATGDDLQPIHLSDPRIAPESYVITFDALLKNRRFVTLMRTILRKLENAYGRPVDIEYTIDILPGAEPDFLVHLLQCRPQARPQESELASVPRDIPPDRVVFASSSTVLRGRVKDIRYIVYVDPEHYSRVQSMAERTRIAQVIGRLNQKLHGNPFILVGPGRWGSSNPELGVPVTYADIYHVDVLVEVPMSIRDEEPEASYGTHFFQDLIESRIYPVAVYPERPGDRFNFEFFRSAPNALQGLLPEDTSMAELVKVIHIPDAAPEMMLDLVMDDSENEAVIAYLSPRV